MSGTIFRPMTLVRTGLLVVMLLVFSSHGVAHDHASNDLERDSACLVCSYTDSAPLSGPASPLLIWTDPAGATAWPYALGPSPRQPARTYLARGPPVSH